MSLTKCINSTATHSLLANTLRKRAYKAPGTRAGIMEDWRHAATNGKAPSRRGNALRDGR